MTQTLIVSNSAQLVADLQAANKATTAEIIELEPGTYAPVDTWGIDATHGVTVESANSANQAVLQSLDIGKSANITFTNLTFSNASTNSASALALSLYNSKVDFTNDKFTGSSNVTLANSASFGVTVEYSTDTTITGSTFEYLHNGVAEVDNNGVTVSDNSFAWMYDDGVDNAGSSNVTITKNTFTDMHPDADDPGHPDLIQFWTVGQSTAGSNIVIEDNSYVRGSGGAVQGIFMRDEVGGLTYSNVTIEDNTFDGTQWNGIFVNDATGVTIEGNTLQSYASGGETSRLVLDNVSGTIDGNHYGALVEEGANHVSMSQDTILPAISGGASSSASPITGGGTSSSAIALVSAMASLAPTSAGGGGGAVTAPTSATTSALAPPSH
jgi:parallel beta-helix repeat protein